MSCEHDDEREICVSKLYSNEIEKNDRIEKKRCRWMFLMRRNSMRELLQYFGCAFHIYAFGVCVCCACVFVGFTFVLPQGKHWPCAVVCPITFSGWLKNFRHSCAKFRINIINIYATRSHSATTFLHYSHFSPINNNDWTVPNSFWPLSMYTIRMHRVFFYYGIWCHSWVDLAFAE